MHEIPIPGSLTMLAGRFKSPFQGHRYRKAEAMRRDGNGRERGQSHDAAANDNHGSEARPGRDPGAGSGGGPEARIEAAAMRLARLLGRQIAPSSSSGGLRPTTTARPARRPEAGRSNDMIRAALYARYSSDLQSAASIEDQFRICRDHAERAGWTVVDTYRDAAISGDSMILRPGIQALLADARSGAFDVVVAEALDRMSHDQADVSALFKHLQFARVMIVTLAEGEINELHVGLKGTMNALFLKDLAAKTHRGLRGRVGEGPLGRRALLRLRRRDDLRCRRRARAGRAHRQRGRCRCGAPGVSGLRFGVSPRTIRQAPQCREHPLSLGQALDRFHHPRPGQARHRAHQQRALHRPPGLEPAALRQEPGDRQAGVADQSA